MKYLLLVVLLSFTSCCLFAQLPKPAMLWMKGYGGSGSDALDKHITKDIDSGLILHIGSNSVLGTGNLDSFCAISGYKDIFIKYKSDGSAIEWTKCYEYNGDSSFFKLFPQIDGGSILGGSFNSSVGWGFLISKQDAIGNIVWQHNYSKGSGAFVKALMPTPDGGYIMLGESLYTDTNALPPLLVFLALQPGHQQPRAGQNNAQRFRRCWCSRPFRRVTNSHAQDKRDGLNKLSGC